MSNLLRADQQLNVGDQLMSTNGAVQLVLQGDGNLVLYPTTGGAAWWASNTGGKPVVKAMMQQDGNFVCYDTQGHPYWNSVTYANPGAYLSLQDDGNLVVYSKTNTPLWASNTGGRVGTQDPRSELQQFI